ncbi:MAG: MarR family transcriptional regulator [Candidatus Woesearchaeota archaeon]|nr:MAG: MarR family transcriptional regulator [Candidatus Woesearchaeota archaeon]
MVLKEYKFCRSFVNILTVVGWVLQMMSAHKIRESKVWERTFEDWDDILDNGFLKCPEVSSQDKALASLLRTSHLIQELLEAQFSSFGVTIAQFHVLELLYFCKKQALSQSEISSKMFCSKANITSLISRMEEKNFVKRSSSKERSREKLVSLTSHGKKIVEKGFEHFERCDKSSLLGKKEAEQLVEILLKVRQGLRKKHG